VKYRIIHNVEIGGQYYIAKDKDGRSLNVILDESAFAAAPPLRAHDNPNEPHLSEAESLLATGHIEVVNE
jgi:hypothetical protein